MYEEFPRRRLISELDAGMLEGGRQAEERDRHEHLLLMREMEILGSTYILPFPLIAFCCRLSLSKSSARELGYEGSKGGGVGP